MPWRRGFDSAFGYFANGVDHFTRCSYKAPRPEDTSDHSWCRRLPMAGHRILYDWYEAGNEGGNVSDGQPTSPMFISPGHPAYDNHTYDTYLFEQRARRIILRHDAATSPLFLYLAFAAIHSPIQATDELVSRVDALRGPDYFGRCGWFDWGNATRNPTPYNPASPLPSVPTGTYASTCHPEKRRVLEAMALGVDDAIGAIVDALKTREGMWERTLLIVLSDNGGALNQQGSNKPLRGGKKGTFEGGIRVGAAIGGGWLPASLHGRSSPHLSHLADWWPTLCHAAGIDRHDGRAGAQVAAVDGRSLWPDWLLERAEPRTVVIDKTVAISSLRGGDALFKLSTAHMDLCTTKVYWSRQSCGSMEVAGINESMLNASVIGGWGEACSLEAPCLFEVRGDEREERKLDPARYATVVNQLLDSMQSSAVEVVDPFYPTRVVCPNNDFYASHGFVRRPSLVDTVFPPRPPMTPPRVLGFHYLPSPPPSNPPQPHAPPSRPPSLPPPWAPPNPPSKPLPGAPMRTTPPAIPSSAPTTTPFVPFLSPAHPAEDAFALPMVGPKLWHATDEAVVVAVSALGAILSTLGAVLTVSACLRATAHESRRERPQTPLRARLAVMQRWRRFKDDHDVTPPNVASHIEMHQTPRDDQIEMSHQIQEDHGQLSEDDDHVS